ACYGYRALVHEQPLHGSLALAAQGHLGCWPYVANRLSRLVGDRKRPGAGVSANADDRTIPHCTAADLCRLHAYPLDGSDLDTRSVGHRVVLDDLLSGWFSVEGKAVQATFWAELHGL